MSSEPAPRRGDVWLADFGAPAGHEQGYRRPAVVVSADRFNATPLGLVVVVPTTSRDRGWPTHVPIPPGVSGLHETSWAKVEDIKSISTKRLISLIGSIDPASAGDIGLIAARILELD